MAELNDSAAEPLVHNSEGLQSMWRFPISVHVAVFVWHVFCLVVHIPGVPDIVSWFHPITSAPASGGTFDIFYMYTTWAIMVQLVFFAAAVVGDVLQVALRRPAWRLATRAHVDRFFVLYWTTCALVGGIFHIFLFVECGTGDCASLFLNGLWLLHGEMLWFAIPEALLVPHGVSESRLHDVILSISLAYAWFLFYWIFYAVSGGQFLYGSNWPLWQLILFVPGHVFVMMIFRVIWRIRQLWYSWCRRSGRSRWIWELEQREADTSTPLSWRGCPGWRTMVPALVPCAVSILFVAALSIYLHSEQ